MSEPDERSAEQNSRETTELLLEQLEWDSWNVEHIARHAVTPGDVEEVCQSRCWVRESYKGRLILIGLTEDGRVLAVVLESLGSGVYYPITARPASRKERRHFHLWKEGKGQ